MPADRKSFYEPENFIFQKPRNPMGAMLEHSTLCSAKSFLSEYRGERQENDLPGTCFAYSASE